MEYKKYTVKDLIEKLKGVDENLFVSLAGCDCENSWNGTFLSLKETDGEEWIRLNI